MDRQLQLHKFMEEELIRYRELEQVMEKMGSSFPDGSLSCRGTNGYRVSLRENGKQYQITLREGDEKLLNSLKCKRFVKEALPILHKKIQLCEQFIKYDEIYDPVAIREKLPVQYHNLNDSQLFLKGDVDPDLWCSEKYKFGTMYESELNHMTERGIPTRSKSEAMIGTALEFSPLDFRYEQALWLDSKVYYPDFTILRPEIRRIIYWEHLGKVDDPDYMLKNLKKLDDFSDHGIYLGKNLVLTYETKDCPLTFKVIKETIDRIMKL